MCTNILLCWRQLHLLSILELGYELWFHEMFTTELAMIQISYFEVNDKPPPAGKCSQQDLGTLGYPKILKSWFFMIYLWELTNIFPRSKHWRWLIIYIHSTFAYVSVYGRDTTLGALIGKILKLCFSSNSQDHSSLWAFSCDLLHRKKRLEEGEKGWI